MEKGPVAYLSFLKGSCQPDMQPRGLSHGKKKRTPGSKTRVRKCRAKRKNLCPQAGGEEILGFDLLQPYLVLSLVSQNLIDEFLLVMPLFHADLDMLLKSLMKGVMNDDPDRRTVRTKGPSHSVRDPDFFFLKLDIILPDETHFHNAAVLEVGVENVIQHPQYILLGHGKPSCEFKGP
jgi:hypothetical protein